MDLKKAYNKIDNFCCSNHNTLQGNKVRYLNNREETINMFQDYQENKDDDFCKDVYEMVEALETIKQLVDLQEELGIPLVILFKLVEQNELYYQFYDELQHWTSVKVDLRKKVVWYCKQVGGHYACSQPLSNYGKTFWLKKDKSE